LRGSTLDAIFRPELLVLTERGKRIQGCLHLKDNVTAFPAVAAIRTAPGDKFLTMEMHHTVAAPA
jgi:hypothetical protein